MFFVQMMYLEKPVYDNLRMIALILDMTLHNWLYTLAQPTKMADDHIQMYRLPSKMKARF